MEHVTEGFIPVKGGNVWFRITGNGPGIPLLLLHGGPGSMSWEKDPLRQLGTERPVIQYDQLGCGNSGRPTDTDLWTVERYVDELEHVIEALELKEFHLLGHSWGSILAASYLLDKRPEGVQSVIFSSPVLSMQMYEADQQKYLKELPKETQEIIERHEREQTTDAEEYQQAVLTYYRRHICRLKPWPKEMEKNLEQLNHQIYKHMLGSDEFMVTGTLKNFDITDRLHEIRVPALFACGRYDIATPEASEYYASLVPDAEFRVFESCSHFPSIEAPEIYTTAIREFINEQEFKPGA